MENKQVKYIGFYDIPESKSDRVSNLAAINKMNYIADSIVEAGYYVNFISPSWMGDKTSIQFEKKRTVSINEYKQVTFAPSWKTTNKVTRNLKILITLVWLFVYLLLNTKKDEPIIVYHVQWVSAPIRAAKFFKKFKLILEVEEVYQDVMKHSERFVKWEDRLINEADAFLYSTDLLKDKLQYSKPYIVVYGEYRHYSRPAKQLKDNKIRLLYAGIIDEHKKGAFNALEASKYLSKNYELHIIGFGKIEKLKEKINENNEINECKVFYDGVKKGKDYLEYCQSFDIGLSTQSMKGDYLESSFPSKILSYLSLGLRVVSGDIRCVTESKIGSLITYYTKDDPREIAEAIKSINIETEYDSRSVMQKMHYEFIQDIKKLIEEI